MTTAADRQLNNLWDEWVEFGIKTGSQLDQLQWELAGLVYLLYKADPKDKDGKLKRFAEAIGQPYGTIKAYGLVAAQYFGASNMPLLSFQHHLVVRKLPDHRRIPLLHMAEGLNLSLADLHEEAKQAKPKLPVTTDSKSELQLVRAIRREHKRGTTQDELCRALIKILQNLPECLANEPEAPKPRRMIDG